MWYFILIKKDTVWLGPVDKLITVAVCVVCSCVCVCVINQVRVEEKYKNKQFYCKEKEKILSVSATLLFLQRRKKEYDSYQFNII